MVLPETNIYRGVTTMSIMGGHASTDPEPKWVHEFDTVTDWVRHVGEKFFGGLLPGEPFLLIVRRMEHDSTGHHFPSTWMETENCVGFLASNGALFGQVAALGGIENNPGLFLETTEFISFPGTYRDGKHTDRREGRIEIGYNHTFRYTPVTKPFKPPFVIGRSHELFDAEVEVFSVACGTAAMAALALAETRWNKGFLAWYTRSILRLGISQEHEKIVETIQRVKAGLISGLHARHNEIKLHEQRVRDVHGSIGIPHMQNGALSIVTDEPFARLMTHDNRVAVQKAKEAIERNLLFAKEIGLHEEFGLLEVDGFRCQPAVVIQDFCKLYAVTL